MRNELSGTNKDFRWYYPYVFFYMFTFDETHTHTHIYTYVQNNLDHMIGIPIRQLMSIHFYILQTNINF